MRVSDVMQALEGLAPTAWAEEWDRVGLQIGSAEAPVSRILLTLDVTSEALLLAERLGSELIIAHHPLIFQPITRLLDAPPQGHLIHRLIQKKTAFFAAHTNLDACVGGVCDALAAVLQLTVQETFLPLGEQADEQEKRMRAQPALAEFLKDYPVHIQPGFGRICVSQPPLHAKPFVQRVNNNLQTTGCLVNFDKDKTYHRLLVWGGAFDSALIQRCVEAQIDCVIAGEIKHHDLIALAELDIHAIAAGHDASERPVLGPLSNYLQKALPDCRVAIHTGLTYNNLVY